MKIRSTSTNFMVGNQYAFFFWGLFALYCIGYQLNKLRILYIRKKRIGGDDNVVTALPGQKLFHFLDRVVKIPLITELFTIRDIIGISLFVIVQVLFTLFAPFTVKGFYELPLIRAIDIRMSFISMANWGFVFFLSQRNSILPAMSGLTFEQLIPYHRILARIGMAELVPHFVFRIYLGIKNTGIVKNGFFKNLEYTTGSVSMFAFIIVFMTSFEWVRRNHFEIFYWSHVICLIPGLIFGAWHEPTCFAYFIPCIVLWIFDRAIRTYKSWFVKSSYVRVDEVTVKTSTQEGIVRVLFENKTLQSAKPGQYIFTSIIVNGKKLWQYSNWHPFTLSEIFRVNSSEGHQAIEENVIGTEAKVGDKKSPTQSVSDIETNSDASSLRRRGGLPYDNQTKTYASFHIKALGTATSNILKAAAANDKLKVYVDGPYGPYLPYQDYPTAVFFATGVGITPSLIMIKDIIDKRASGVRTVATEQVYLNWTIRSIEETSAYIELFTYLAEKVKNSVLPVVFNVKINVTRMNEGHNPTEGLAGFSVSYGERPDISIELEKVKTFNPDRRIFSHVCGNSAFTRTVLNESFKRGFDAHHESFEL